MTTEINLTHMNGAFDETSIQRIDEIDHIFPGFKFHVMDLYENRIIKSSGKTDQRMSFSNINVFTENKSAEGYVLNVHLINNPVPDKEKEAAEAELLEKETIEYLTRLSESYKYFYKKDIADLVIYYLSQRDRLKKNSFGQYVRIKPNKGIEICDYVPINGEGEISFRIGKEWQKTSIVCFGKSFIGTKSVYTIPITIQAGAFKSGIIDAVIDTGCTNTTITRNVIPDIEKANNMQAGDIDNTFGKRDVIGFENSLTTCTVIPINMIFGDILCKQLDINLADIPNNIYCLIGMDIINSGVLHCDSGNRISFTRH